MYRGGCLCIVCLLTACSWNQPDVYMQQGKQHVFHGRWWNYYGRGTAELEKKDLAAAEKDFRQALKMRDQDAWSARTYGLHFVEYFPNRELGITYYEMGRLEDAEKYLRQSLKQLDTARAHYYLDLITREKLKSGALKDTTRPQVETSLDKHSLLNSRDVVCSLSARDDVGVSRVLLNGQEIPLRASEREFQTADKFILDEGTHAFKVQVDDLSGKKTEREIQATVDLTGPMIGIIAPTGNTVTQAKTLRLRGVAMDANGVQWLKVNETPVAVTPGARQVPFEQEIPLKTGPNRVIIKCCDTAGNETASVVSVFRGNPHALGARIWKVEQRMGHPLRLASQDPAVLEQVLAAAENQPEAPVAIQVKYPRPRTSKAPFRKQEVMIAGSVKTQDDLKVLRIQDREYPVLPGVRSVEFTRRVPVNPGKNKLEVAAADKVGHQADWTEELEAQPVLIDEDDYKMKVAVQHIEGLDPKEEAFYTQTLEGFLGTVRNHRFAVLERAQLETILTEQQLGSSALADPRFAIKLGSLKPADVFLFGSAFSCQDKGLEIRVQVIETGTGVILDSYDTFIKDTSDRKDRNLRMEEIARWMADTFPRVTGSVKALVGKNPWVDLGKDDGVRKGLRIVVVYEAVPAEVDEQTGEVYEEPIYDALGWAPVIRVERTRSKLDVLHYIVDQGEGLSIASGQPVFSM